MTSPTVPVVHPGPAAPPPAQTTHQPSWLAKSWRISRPRFWLYLAGPYLLGVAAGSSSPTVFWSPIFWLLLAYFLVPANFFLYGINDTADADTDQFNPKKESHEYRYHPADARWLRPLLGQHLVITLALSLWLPPGWIPSLLLLLWLLSWSYSAPPLRWKAHPFLDSLSNFLYLLPGLAGYVLATGQLPAGPVILGGVAWTTAMHLFSAIPDIAADQRAGLRTTAVVLGRPASLWLCAGLWLLTAGLVVGQLTDWWRWLLWLYPLLPLLVLWRLASLDRVYWWFPWINGGLGGLAFAFLFGRLL